MTDRTPDEIQAEIDAAHSAEAALEAELLGALKPSPEVTEAAIEAQVPPAPKQNWHPNGGQEVALMIRASQAGLVREPGVPITKDEVLQFLASKGMS